MNFNTNVVNRRNGRWLVGSTSCVALADFVCLVIFSYREFLSSHSVAGNRNKLFSWIK